VVLALEARKIPPTVIVLPINSSIKVAEWGVDIVTGMRDWFLPEEFSKSSAQVRRAGINSFGYGGANAHVVLEEAAAWVNSSSNLKQSNNFQDNIITSDRKVFLLPFSASCIQSLRARVSQLAAINTQTFDLHSLAYTLGCRRTHFPIRGFLTLHEESFYENLDPELLQTLPSQEAQPPSRPLTFVFTGQGAQWPGMGKELFKEFASFRHAIQDMDSALKQLPHAPLWRLEGGSFPSISILIV
jgi:acyl transferase domain-containing protein